jgi:ATP-dependent Lon protease
MPQEFKNTLLPPEKLRWRLDPATLSFETTEDLQPLKDIIGQARGVEAFRFGININKPGYNVFVTGAAGSGRMATVKKLLEEMSKRDRVPDDLCYVNCFENPESPLLIRLEGGKGAVFKKDIKNLVETLKKEIPLLFESQDYINMKKEITETYERQASDFFKALDQKVKEEGFTVVDVQVGMFKRPEVMPIIDGKPVPIEELEAMVEKGRFPKAEYEQLKEKQATLKKQIEQIFWNSKTFRRMSPKSWRKWIGQPSCKQLPNWQPPSMNAIKMIRLENTWKNCSKIWRTISVFLCRNRNNRKYRDSRRW